MTQRPTIAVVTGASRGAGRGIAIALGSHGCTVYVTGRSRQAGDHPLPGTIYETAASVTAAGGTGIAVAVDHGSDEQPRALSVRAGRKRARLNILVNTAATVHNERNPPGPFWDKPLHLADMI